jgi:hypothetical protein
MPLTLAPRACSDPPAFSMVIIRYFDTIYRALRSCRSISG